MTDVDSDLYTWGPGWPSTTLNHKKHLKWSSKDSLVSWKKRNLSIENKQVFVKTLKFITMCKDNSEI